MDTKQGNSPEGGGVAPRGNHKIPVNLDVCLRPTSTAIREDVAEAVVRFIEDIGILVYAPHALELPTAEEDPFLHAHVESALVSDLGERAETLNPLGAALFGARAHATTTAHNHHEGTPFEWMEVGHKWAPTVQSR
jgi:hypothetical protein